MPIISSDIQLRLSGGASNSIPDASLGGVISRPQMGTELPHNLFDLYQAQTLLVIQNIDLASM